MSILYQQLNWRCVSGAASKPYSCSLRSCHEVPLSSRIPPPPPYIVGLDQDTTPLQWVVREKQIDILYIAYIFYRVIQNSESLKSSFVYRPTAVTYKVRELYLQCTVRSARAEHLCPKQKSWPTEMAGLRPVCLIRS
jgi:hypothetical protein